MNITTGAIALLAFLGAIATRHAWPGRRLTTWGLGLVALIGPGGVLVALAPENVNRPLHLLGAALVIPVANIGIVLLGAALCRARWVMGIFSLCCGTVGLVGVTLLKIGPSADVGGGTAERFAFYPEIVWLVALGTFLLWFAAGSRMREGGTMSGTTTDPRPAVTVSDLNP